MNNIQNIIDRQIGIYSRFNYDNILKRLVVSTEESFYGLQSSLGADSFDHDPPIFACRFSEAPGFEHILALANEDGKVAFQDTSKVSVAANVEGFQCHNNAVFDLTWMPGHMSYVTVSGDHTASLWDVGESSPRRTHVFSGHSRSVKTAAFPPSEPRAFATGARDGNILIWDLRDTHTPTTLIKPDNSLINCHACFQPKTPGSHSKRPRIDTHRAISITGLVFQDDQTLISCGESDGNIKAWDLRKNYNIYKREPLPKHSIPYCGSSTKNGYTNLIIDDTRMKLYASCMDNVIYCFNISTYNTIPEQRYIGHENSTYYIKTSLSPDNMYLVSGSSDKNAYIWNVKYSQPIVKLVGHWAEVTCAAWCQKGDTKIVTCSDDARHKIWRIGREYIDDSHILELKGKAEAISRSEVPSLPQWGALDKTPSSLKRKIITTPVSSSSAKRVRTEEKSKKTKRCLTDLMNATKENEQESLAKRLRLDIPPTIEETEPKLLPTGIKRPYNSRDGDMIDSVPSTSYANDLYSPKASTTCLTLINYEKNSENISPNSQKSFSIHNKSPVNTSPNKVRIVTFTTPTKNLPNFVLDGEAPHLKLMSPVKKKQETTNWLTLMVREKRGKTTQQEPLEKPSSPVPVSPKDVLPTRRSSTSEKTPKPIKNNKTLLKYFTVTHKEK